MSGPTIGIDIADYQPDQVPGDWLFVVLKVTEGDHLSNEKAAAQWAFAGGFPHRGLYHYAIVPPAGDAAAAGRAQAQYFAGVALSMGFRKDVDLWQLDAEGSLNEQVDAAQWAAFVPAFMDEALSLLGKCGFLYVGQYFEPSVLASDAARYNWWLPNYGPNDGQVHSLPGGVDPVMHQFSSAGGLDQNVVYDAAKWAALIAPPVDWKAIAKLLAFRKAMAALAALLAAVTKRPARYLDKGSNVRAIQTLLVKHHYALKVDGVYGTQTVFAVHAFKVQHGWPAEKQDGHYCGRKCLLALLKP